MHRARGRHSCRPYGFGRLGKLLQPSHDADGTGREANEYRPNPGHGYHSRKQKPQKTQILHMGHATGPNLRGFHLNMSQMQTPNDSNRFHHLPFPNQANPPIHEHPHRTTTYHTGNLPG